MKRALLISIILFICLNGCNRKSYNANRDYDSKKNQDTITSIIERLCGFWELHDNLKKQYDAKGIGTGGMDVLCLVNIENGKLINQLLIERIGGLSEAEVPKNVDSLFFPSSDSTTISKKGKYYGLKYHNLENTSFIPIKKLSDSLLILADGRVFQKTK